ncbi:hypothetical protein PspLS_07223 [Pyricularia sp. CBS 133598]|nr:hypothetical protein PspLS_07223 [Pyricularia sp. CBS 133598]
MVWRAGGCTRSISSPRAATTAPMHWTVGLYCTAVYCNYRTYCTGRYGFQKPNQNIPRNILCR